VILIVSNPRDVHAHCVAADIESAGGSAVIMDIDEFGNGALLSHRLGASGLGAISTRDGRRIALDQIRSIWVRRMGCPRPDPKVRDPADRSFALREWDAAIDGVMTAAGIKLVSSLWAQRAAVKPLQLAVARRAGLRVPDTLISNDRGDCERFVDEHHGRVVHKVLTAAAEGIAETCAWQDSDCAALADLIFAPTIFQERIDAAHDVRATVIGSEVYSMKIAVAPDVIDSRTDFDAACEAIRLPDHVEDQLRRVMKDLNLMFGAVDLRVTPDGEFVFFEVNPQGQFLFVEILTGLPLSAALAAYLMRNDLNAIYSQPFPVSPPSSTPFGRNSV
jgi:hypothetical protein